MTNRVEKKLQVHNLRISFRTNDGKVQAVRDISFDLHKGETLAIVGESGSGKSVTSKAILGILAGNSIVEGGEILYDGQDLLKISEDDFYRLRGDKIAMIFQDPLSSLNPIMKIGKQLTEAMLLKGKARQRSCKDNFKTKLDLLEKRMAEADPANAAKAKQQCDTFRKFEAKHTELEQAYNNAYEAAEEALEEVKNLIFLMEKDAFKDVSALRQAKEFALRTFNPYVVTGADEAALRADADALLSTIKEEMKSHNYAATLGRLNSMKPVLEAAVAKTKPDFFAMGYYLTCGGSNAPTGSVEEANAFYADYMAKDYMDAFEEDITKAIIWSDKQYLEKRKAVVTALEKAYNELKGSTVEAFKPTANALSKQVEASVDPLDIIKDSAACTFPGSMKSFLDSYDLGKRTNKRKQAKYDKEVAKAEKRAAKGKDYKVALPTTIDLDLVKENMLTLIDHLKAHYIERNEADVHENKRYKTDTITDYLKDNASGMVLKITKQAARNKALKLMEEVGIPEPRKRYNQYPFEFSGGMRQRIVIAIALAANPEILICDEPTTALDVTIQAQILELIQDLKKKRNLSVIFITHELGVVANMADRIAVMYAGKIVEYGTSEEIFYEPAHPYTWALLSSMPDLDSKDKLEAIPGTPPDMRYPPKGDAFAQRNRYAMKIDFEEQPPAFPITETHWAATWLLHPDMPHQVQPPKAVTDRIAKMKERMEVEGRV